MHAKESIFSNCPNGLFVKYPHNVSTFLMNKIFIFLMTYFINFTLQNAPFLCNMCTMPCHTDPEQEIGFSE